MRIPIAATVVCSTLSTFALYQAFAALFPHVAHPDDDSAPDVKQDGTKAQQLKTSTKAIAVPERMPIASVRTNAPQKAGQLVANRSATSRGSLPTVNVPPKLRSLPNRLSALPSFDSSSRQNVPSDPLTGTTNQLKAGAIDQSQPDVGTTQSLPFTSVIALLSDVKGHWAENYIESLAAKGVVRGFRDGRFRPDELVTSEQFTLMVQKAFNVSPISYSDLQQLHPDRTPTRADAAAFLYQTLAKAQSAPLTMAVQVSGAVPRPGIYAIENGSRIDSPPDAGMPTVSRAIQRAGGALDGAKLHQVQIHRISDTSARQVINVDVRQLLQTGDRSRDIVLQQGDKLFIPTAATAATGTTPQIPGAVPTPERPISLVERMK